MSVDAQKAARSQSTESSVTGHFPGSGRGIELRFVTGRYCEVVYPISDLVADVTGICCARSLANSLLTSCWRRP